MGHTVFRSRQYHFLGGIGAFQAKGLYVHGKEHIAWYSPHTRDRFTRLLGNAGIRGRVDNFLSLSILHRFFVGVLVRAGSCRWHLPQQDFLIQSYFRPTSHNSSRAFTSMVALCAKRKSSSEANGVSSTLPRPTQILLHDEASLPQSTFRLRRKGPSSKKGKPAELKPKDPTEMKNLIFFLEELARPTEADTLDSLFTRYRALPTPRLSYLRIGEANLLLSRFMNSPVRTDILMIRYLSIVDDMREIGIPLTRKEWITAMSFVGQRFDLKVGLPEIEASLKLWSELELKAGAESSPVMFNILLDMASKARQHSVINAILAEMEARKIKYDRYTFTTLITWYGWLRDATSVRETFTKLVESGEVVDTVIFNALITAFIKSGEWDTAEELFGKMKTLGLQFQDAHSKMSEEMKRLCNSLNFDGSPISPSRDTAASRKLGKELRYMVNDRRRQSESADSPFPGDFGSQVYCGPNIVTFNIFLHNYCRHGDFDRTTTLLSEMHSFKIPYEASIFLSLFKGFTLHGRGLAKSSQWTAERIEETYAALIREVIHGGVKLSTVLSCEIVKAFAVTTMSRAKTIKVYRDLTNLYKDGYGFSSEIDPVVKQVLQRAIGGPLEDVNMDNKPTVNLAGDQLNLERIPFSNEVRHIDKGNVDINV